MINNINNEIKQVNYCLGCQMCAAVCPNHAIDIELNDEGFYSPQINQELCSNCGLCVKNCYKYDDNIQITTNKQDKRVYAAVTKNDEILKASTSGGISSHLMSACLKQGYKVVGVAYDYQKDIAFAEIISRSDEIAKFRGSKYMQAHTKEAFRTIIDNDKDSRYAIFGTPCQIYALNKWATNNGLREQFLFVDLFCHGCPSLNLWKKYLEYIKEKVKVSKFEKIEFRSKQQGWHEYCHCFYKEDIQVVSDKTIDDPFFTFFLDNEILGHACYDCQLRSTLEYTDIRLGDFWGEEYDLNTEGVSAVVIRTEKGKELFDAIKPLINIKKSTFDNVIKAQSYGTTYTYNPEIRRRTMELLKSEQNMQSILKNYIKLYTFERKLYRRLKKISYILPPNIRYKIKKFYHKLVNR